MTSGGTIVTLTANTVSDYISVGEYVQTTIFVNTQAAAQNPITWPALCSGADGGTGGSSEAVAGDMEVQIVTLTATALALPHIVAAGRRSIPITYTTTSTGTDLIKSTNITIPSGFTYVSTGAVTATGSKNWTPSQAGGVVTLTANTVGDYISQDAAIINVATTAIPQAGVTWPDTVSGATGSTFAATEAVAGDMKVAIAGLLAYAVATPHIVDGGQNIPISYKTTNGGSENIQAIQITVPAGFTLASTGTLTVASNKNWTVSSGGSSVTLTANTAGDDIVMGEFVQLPMNVTTSAGPQGATIWPSVVTGASLSTTGAIELVGGDMKVAIYSLSATSVVTPHTVDGGQASIAMTYATTNTGTDQIKRRQAHAGAVAGVGAEPVLLPVDHSHQRRDYTFAGAGSRNSGGYGGNA